MGQYVECSSQVCCSTQAKRLYFTWYCIDSALCIVNLQRETGLNHMMEYCSIEIITLRSTANHDNFIMYIFDLNR